VTNIRTTGGVAVIGAGMVGQSWAISFARAGLHVHLHDVNASATQAALNAFPAALDDLARLDLLDGQDTAAVLARITPFSALEDAVEGVAHVQENTPEQVEMKRIVFARIDAAAHPDTTIASSTSALLPSAFAADLPGRARCMVAHPLNPPHLIPAVEIVPAPFTDPAAIERCRNLMEQAGQAPLVLAHEVPGFVMNRLQGALLDEAIALVAEGVVSPADVDRAMAMGLARRWSFMGPFETIDLNAPGGIADFIARYGAAYAEIGRSRPGRHTWTDALAAELATAREAALPRKALAGRRSWRDTELARLAAHFGKERG
jgi:L-gulonate 3-dehydrogenase